MKAGSEKPAFICKNKVSSPEVHFNFQPDLSPPTRHKNDREATSISDMCRECCKTSGEVKVLEYFWRYPPYRPMNNVLCFFLNLLQKTIIHSKNFKEDHVYLMVTENSNFVTSNFIIS